MNLYTRKDWIDFREAVIKLDDGRCTQCHRSRSETVILQVHHKHYIQGRKPWDYRYNECETLCKGCHAAEHGKVAPKSGWECIGSYDLEDLSGNCDLCGANLRYLYLVHHPKWPAMEVGTDCCDHLTGNTSASEFNDDYVKKREKRRRFTSSPRWKKEDDNTISIVQDRIPALIFKNQNHYKIYINGIPGDNIYTSLIDAKIRLFEFIDSGEAKEFLDERSGTTS